MIEFPYEWWSLWLVIAFYLGYVLHIMYRDMIEKLESGYYE